MDGGFGEVAAALGWIFPDTLQPGNWENLVVNFPEVAHLANIQCENCHGPGSLHFGANDKMEITLDQGMCGRCHEDGHYHRNNNCYQYFVRQIVHWHNPNLTLYYRNLILNCLSYYTL